MIETKMGEVTLKGSKAELIADLSVVVRGIKEAIMEDDKETEESVKQEIDEAVKLGLMNEEEFKTIQKEKIKEIAKHCLVNCLEGFSMKINEFDKTVDELYQLCRRVQKETGRTVAFHFANYKIGCSLHINIYKKESLREFDMYSIAEGGYQQEENVKKVTDHLNKILMDNKCPYCEGDCDGERK